MEEQHAVPQDITGFKFKLVGDMTLKQFGELAFGAIMAYVFYASSWNPLLKWPLTLFFGFFGVALAFLPIEERPLDVWIVNFFRAIYRPTYYVWKKDTNTMTAVSFSPPPVLTKETPPPPPPTPIDIPMPALAPVTPSLSIDELEKMRAEKLAKISEPKKEEVKKEPEIKPEPMEIPNRANVVTVDQLAAMRKSTQKEEADKPLAPGEVRAPIKATPTISLTEVPNIINGSVFDQRGAPMEGVVLVIKDKAGNSVRALKTNRVGQFIVSTPLENGTYYLEFEMPSYEFKVYEVILDGKVIKSIDIRGKYVEKKT